MKNKGLKSAAKAILLIFIFSVILNFQVILPVSALDGSSAGGLSEFVTNHDPNNYAKISFRNDTIIVEGKYTSEKVVDVAISGVPTTSYTFDTSGNSFSSEMDCVPPDPGIYNLYIYLSSKHVLAYLVGYGDGWYIPDNGLIALNAEKLENVKQAAPLAAAYYISPNADKAEIKDTMDSIKAIAEEVCYNVEDDYQKAYLLNRWVADNIYYDHDAAESDVTIETVALCNVLKNRRTTCAGFANIYCALLESVGIRSVNLKGAAVAGDITYETLTTGGENHEFTAFWYEEENRWAYVDSCWSGAGDYINGEYLDVKTYDKYFDISGAAFAMNHRIDKVEERFYTKALAAVEANEATQILQTSDGGENNDPSEDTDNEKNDKNDNNSDNKIDKPKNPSSEEKGGKNYIVYIITAVVGVLAVIAGIAIAAKRKKSKKRKGKKYDRY